jgi:hypothetical protein
VRFFISNFNLDESHDYFSSSCIVFVRPNSLIQDRLCFDILYNYIRIIILLPLLFAFNLFFIS